MDYAEWMLKVDAAVQRLAGVSVDDLPDCCFRDWLDDELTPLQAALEALRNADW